MRVFLGIDFNNEVKKDISLLQKELRVYMIKGRWKYHENFHLTLKFFENINDTQKIDIDRAVKAMCGNCGKFKLGFGELGTFGGKESIRVLWMGITTEVDKLNKLHDDLDCSLNEYGFEKDRRSFKPHITIGQDLLFRCTLDELNKYKAKIIFPKMTVDRLHLFKSEQIGSKRVYTKIEEYRL
jgi:2'-5' RNA ligase